MIYLIIIHKMIILNQKEQILSLIYAIYRMLTILIKHFYDIFNCRIK